VRVLTLALSGCSKTENFDELGSYKRSLNTNENHNAKWRSFHGINGIQAEKMAVQ